MSKSLSIAVGDDVRVHFHPPFPVKSFVEGMVTRIDETVPLGPLIVVDVTQQVILGKVSPIRHGHQEYILSARWQDFDSHIEILHPAAQKSEEPVSDVVNPDVSKRDRQIPAHEHQNAAADIAQEAGHQEVRRRGGIIASLFGRGK
jgi:hypothetical protein